VKKHLGLNPAFVCVFELHAEECHIGMRDLYSARLMQQAYGGAIYRYVIGSDGYPKRVLVRPNETE
jgi:hypothetical protein